MSRGARQALPSQKGTELWPKVTQPPAKLVIEGVPPETLLYRAVANIYAGRLKAFHAKAQQEYALSNNAIASRRFDWGDGARATYTNLDGQEILTLEVAASILEQITEELSKQFSPWDWAIVNFKVPDIEQAAFAAYLKVPILSDPPVIGKGVSVDHGDAGQGNKPMSFPDASNPEFEQLPAIPVAGSFTAASTLTDLTIVDPKSAVVIDVYGRLGDQGALCAAQRHLLPVTYHLSLPTVPPSSDLTGTSITGPLIDDYPWSLFGFIQFRMPTDCTVVEKLFYLGSFPTTTSVGHSTETFPAQTSFSYTLVSSALDEPTTITFTATRVGASLVVTIDNPENIGIAIYGSWDPSFAGAPLNNWLTLTVAGKTDGAWNTSNSYRASATIDYSDESGSPADAHDSGYSTQNAGAQTSYNYIFVPYIEATPDPTADDVGEITADAIIAGVIGKGSAQWVFSEHTSDIAQFNAWELRSAYPNPVPTAVLKDGVTMSNKVSDGAVVDPLNGYPFLGQIIADRGTGALTFSKA